MQRTLLALALVASGTPALAQSVLAPDPLLNPTTCADFTSSDSAGRLQLLRGVQPLGDDIEPGDENAAEQWSQEVAAACADHPDRPLTDPAAAALGAD